MPVKKDDVYGVVTKGGLRSSSMSKVGSCLILLGVGGEVRERELKWCFAVVNLCGGSCHDNRE